VFLNIFAEIATRALGKHERSILLCMWKYGEKDGHILEIRCEFGTRHRYEPACSRVSRLAREEFSRHVRKLFSDLRMTVACHIHLSEVVKHSKVSPCATSNGLSICAPNSLPVSTRSTSALCD